ncbi:hypothetical protein BO82DRAFT_32026 [Aspergillus uvarum CBS 121591]|uniref:Uncharacterized protein n=1 Tax=Aspergillus uvarum CBS 121591 TaxID=1448315 RepID=A0A319CJR9_9EURO|nr:hypothetical protein BO82DRAFT_32026 [Aspergillus uvarum CBS 121591]PYH84081.1 hypothetical protein BO82DRAFT_32026 [Aspergillus uvarum CBS 121591]
MIQTCGIERFWNTGNETLVSSRVKWLELHAVVALPSVSTTLERDTALLSPASRTEAWQNKHTLPQSSTSLWNRRRTSCWWLDGCGCVVGGEEYSGQDPRNDHTCLIPPPYSSLPTILRACCDGAIYSLSRGTVPGSREKEGRGGRLSLFVFLAPLDFTASLLPCDWLPLASETLSIVFR